MKICLIFMIVGWVALMPGRGHAASQSSSQDATNRSSDHAREAEHTAPTEQRNHRTDGKPSTDRRDYRLGSSPSHANAIKPSVPKQLPNRPKRSTSGNATKLHEPGSSGSDGRLRGGSVQSKNASAALPVRPPTVVRPPAPPPDTVRHGGTNPAVIGGSANSDARNTGALNGTRMPHKP